MQETAINVQFQNPGIVGCGKPVPATPRCLVTLGVARGGTSLVAGTLHHLGVFMGDQANAPVYEDERLARAFEKIVSESASAVVKDYNSRHAVWAWKRPGCNRYLKKLASALPTPHFIVIYKDLCSIATRNEISMNFDAMKNMRSSLRAYSRLDNFIQKTDAPLLLVSYEKAVRFPAEFIDSLIVFGGIEPSDQQKQAAIEFIRPDPKDYLEISRADRIVGHVDLIDEKRICGWASRMRDTGSVPIRLNLIINGEIVAQTSNTLHRKDILKSGMHQTGSAGFEFVLDEHHQLGAHDEVRVVVSDTNQDLPSSAPVFAT